MFTLKAALFLIAGIVLLIDNHPVLGALVIVAVLL